MGHALSFSGDILHGGDPITRGIRYIIACFCYSQGESTPKQTPNGNGPAACRLRDGLGRVRRVSGDRDREGDVQDGEYGKEEALRGSVLATGQGGAVPGDGDVGGVRECGAAKNGIEFRADDTFSFGFS